MLEIDGASNRGIDEIRQIIDNVRYQPANSRFKIYIIDEVHQVTKDAFNALLENPGGAAAFGKIHSSDHRAASLAGDDSVALPALRLSPHQSARDRATAGRDRQERRARASPKARWSCWRARPTAACAMRSRCWSRFSRWRRRLTQGRKSSGR